MLILHAPVVKLLLIPKLAHLCVMAQETFSYREIILKLSTLDSLDDMRIVLLITIINN